MCELSTVLRTEIKSMLLHLCVCPCPNSADVLWLWFPLWCCRLFDEVLMQVQLPPLGSGPLCRSIRGPPAPTPPPRRSSPGGGKASASLAPLASRGGLTGRFAGEALCVFVLAPRLPDLAVVFRTWRGSQKRAVCYLAPPPYRFPLARSCVIMCSLFIRPNLLPGDPWPYSAQTQPLQTSSLCVLDPP